MSGYHEPVLLQSCIEGLAIKADGIYVDATFGGGGHARGILEQLDSGKLLAFDQDQDAAGEAKKIESQNFLFIHQNFSHISAYLKLHKSHTVDGILADLGISSHQIDTPQRGFSIRHEGPLDMRMDQSQERGATELLMESSPKQLQDIFSRYGELRNSKTLAEAVVAAREHKPLTTTADLVKVARAQSHGNPNQYLAQVFQALRIEVNGELKALEELLLSSVENLKTGGRLVVLSYHSLEDRLVKNFIKAGNFTGQAEKDMFGRSEVPLKAVIRKPITPTEKECQANPRARSAKLRIAERL